MLTRAEALNSLLLAESGHSPGAMPAPNSGERPTAYADRIGEWYTRQQTADHRKNYGLYLTPVSVADFMAKQVQVEGECIRILDPSAGAGVLACATVEALVSRPGRPSSIKISAHEIQDELVGVLHDVLGYLRDWCQSNHSVAISVHITRGDFVLAHADALRSFGALIPYDSPEQGFDVVIANPPYFKIQKNDPRAVAAASVVHGQPNIYGLFMAVGAALLRDKGDFVFITPRSFASGPYFKRLRQTFFEMVRPESIHVFGSRREAFIRDEVLQENIILHGKRADHWRWRGDDAVLSLTSSLGVRDIGESSRRSIPMARVFHSSDRNQTLRLPPSTADDDVLTLVDGWPQTLGGLGLNISTGPVVPFRAVEAISDTGDVPATHVPLLWMNHVQSMQVTWPLNRHKPEYMKAIKSRTLLLPNQNYVLLRRFSAKEETRRLTAAPYLAERFPCDLVGIENHLNYIYRPGGALSENEVWGLAALYNSSLLDTYFRCVNGNTQVSATELRGMPLPDISVVRQIGQRMKEMRVTPDSINALVMQVAAPERASEVTIG